MSNLELMPWDSSILGVNVARVRDTASLPEARDMDQHDLVVARLPMDWDEGREQYQEAGFGVVTLDMSMAALLAGSVASAARDDTALIWLRRQKPTFLIDGFAIEDSRLMRDTRCRSRLPARFWDSVVEEHCSSYADMVACALDRDGKRLLGMISCFIEDGALELFLVSVLPECQSQGIGGELMAFVAAQAVRNGLILKTEVLATNVKAMNFYLRHGFAIKSGVTVMHRWRDRMA